jgi:rubredoxin
VPEDWVCPDCGVREQVDFVLAGTGDGELPERD